MNIIVRLSSAELLTVDATVAIPGEDMGMATNTGVEGSGCLVPCGDATTTGEIDDVNLLGCWSAKIISIASSFVSCQ